MEREAGVEPAISPAHGKDDMNMEVLMCPNNSRKEIFCVCRGVPRWRSRVESGEDGLGCARLPVGVGRAQPESNRRFPAVRQGVLPT